MDFCYVALIKMIQYPVTKKLLREGGSGYFDEVYFLLTKSKYFSGKLSKPLNFSIRLLEILKIFSRLQCSRPVISVMVLSLQLSQEKY